MAERVPIYLKKKEEKNLFAAITVCKLVHRNLISTTINISCIFKAIKIIGSSLNSLTVIVRTEWN